MFLKRYRCLSVLPLLAVLFGCAQQSPQEVKEKTAETTATIKSDAQAVAAGIREGWSRDKPLDLNSATKDDLMALPGVSSVEADRIISARPYNASEDLVERHIMPKSEYDKISDRITAKK